MKRFISLFLLSLLAACTVETAVEPTAAVTAVPPTAVVVVAPETVEPTAVPTISIDPTDEPALPEPTALPPTEPPPTPEVEMTEMVVEYGRTKEGAFFQGMAGAPVTLIDYSDFL